MNLSREQKGFIIWTGGLAIFTVSTVVISRWKLLTEGASPDFFCTLFTMILISFFWYIAWEIWRPEKDEDGYPPPPRPPKRRKRDPKVIELALKRRKPADGVSPYRKAA